MGNTENKAKNLQATAQYGGIYVKPEKDHYVAGEQFRGVVYINFTTTYPGSIVTVRFKGCEKYKYAYITHNKNNTTHHLLHNRIKFMDTKNKIYDNGSQFLPGQYAFPFSFLIPSGFPGSLYLEGNHTIAAVEYKIEAVVETYDPKAPKMVYRNFLIIEEPRKLQVLSFQKQGVAKLETCCCCSQGQTTITVSFEKDALIPGETTNIKFSVDNSQGKLDCTFARIELVQNLVLDMGRRVLRHFVLAADQPGFKAGENVTDKIVTVTLPKYNPWNVQNKKLFYRYANFHDIYARRYNPNELVPSISSRVVNVRYFLGVELFYSGCTCCAVNPTVAIPVQIYLPQFQITHDIQAPKDWNPKILPTTNFSVGGDPTTNNYIQQQEQQQDPQNNLIGQMNTNNNLMKPMPNYNANTFT